MNRFLHLAGAFINLDQVVLLSAHTSGGGVYHIQAITTDGVVRNGSDNYSSQAATESAIELLISTSALVEG